MRNPTPKSARQFSSLLCSSAPATLRVTQLTLTYHARRAVAYRGNSNLIISVMRVTMEQRKLPLQTLGVN